MKNLSKLFLDLSEMERLAVGDSLIHRLDPRCKVALALLFSAVVASFDHYAVFRLLPFFAFPIFLMVVAETPAGYLAEKMLIVSAFAFAVAIANPFIDRSGLLEIGGVSFSGGWVSFCSIMLRFVLTASCALLLLATTGLRDISKGLEKMGVPRTFASQLFLLCRSLFLLSDEAARMTRGRDSRSIGAKGGEFSTSCKFTATLVGRSIDRAERVHAAMLARGFDGSLPTAREFRWRTVDTFFLLFWSLAFAIFRFL